jgi:tetratricopeptide (TPR) repeat protein
MLESRAPLPADTYYNLLVQGFRAGQLDLKTEVPPGLLQLPDPYDPNANCAFRLQDGHPLHDLSFYRGKLYLYFGITPALVAFWPYTALTGHYLLHKHAVVLFDALGFLAAVALLCALWRRYFPELRLAILLAGVLALGLAAFAPLILPRCDVYEVAISCGSACAMLALVAIWRALHQPPALAARWLALGSVAYGLAVGARPSLLFGAAILLLPVAQARHKRYRLWTPLLAAIGPLILIGLGLMLYNFLRFDRPLEFGQRYMMAGTREDTVQHFSLHYLWFNLRAYFLQPVRWGGPFPFVHDAALPPLPAGYGWVEHPFGVLTNLPVVWLALAAPLAWQGRSPETRSTMRWFVSAVALLFGLCAMTIALYYSACLRYQTDFVPALVLLAVIGIFGLERTLASRPPVWRRAARCGWGLLLAASLAFSLLAALDRLADSESVLGNFLLENGRLDQAILHLQKALAIRPADAPAHRDLGIAFFQRGQVRDALAQFQTVVDIQPDSPEAHMNLGNLLHLQPGQLDNALAHFQKAVELQPNDPQAHNNFANVLAEKDRVPDALSHYFRALEIRPNYAEAHFSLGRILLQTSHQDQAVAHLLKGLALRPSLAAACNTLAWTLATSPDPSLRNGARAVELARHLDQLAGGNNASILATLAAAYAEANQFPEAISLAQKAHALALAQGETRLAAKTLELLEVFRSGHPYRQPR